MIQRRIFCCVLALCMTLTLAGCSASSMEVRLAADAKDPAENTQPVASSGMSIPLGALTQEPQFFDWNADGTAMQLIALTDVSGEVQLAYNTCQVCAGSPYAYFELENAQLVCQNCGNAFPYSAVGRMTGGCNPMPVTDYAVTEDAIDVPLDELAENAKAFANWKGAQ